MKSTDLIVVGGGLSGCMLTHELVRQFGLRVTLIETAAESARTIDRERPARWLNLLGSTEDFQLSTTACPRLASRRLQWPRGKGLGGSSRINAMIWFPPTEQDLKMLVEASGGCWSIGTLQAAAERAESLVRPECPTWLSEASQRFLAAAADFPGANPTAYQRFNRRGQRWSAESFLAGLPTGSLTIVRGSVEQLTWDATAATGVVVREGSARRTINSGRGVILSAGVIGSPTILMRSGIGPAEVLAAAGVAIRLESPVVGANLQDHLIMPVIYGVDPRYRFAARATPAEVARWQVTGAGPVASNLAECGGLFEGSRFQLHVTPTHYLSFPRAEAAAMTLGVSLTAPRSRGQVRIASADPAVPPTVEANYLADDQDLRDTIRGIELARELARKSPLAGWLRGELVPGPDRSDPSTLARAIARYAQTLYHPIGTCALGASASSSESATPVVDAGFRVIGAQRLWVADGSVCPTITVGNPSATLLMIAVLAAGEIMYQL